MTPELLSAGATVGSGIIGGITSIVNTNKTIRAQKSMAEDAYERDKEMYFLNRDYNEPIMQMDRLKKAGLNPHLIYGQGANATNISRETPKYQAPRLEYNYDVPVDAISGLQLYQDLKYKSAMIDMVNERSNTQKLENQLRSGRIQAQIDEAIAKAKAEGNKADVSYFEKLEKEWKWYNGKTIESINAQVAQSQAQAKTAGFEAQIKQMHKEWAEKGLNPSDALWMRQIVTQGGNLMDFIKRGQKNVKKFDLPLYDW